MVCDNSKSSKGKCLISSQGRAGLYLALQYVYAQHLPPSYDEDRAGIIMDGPHPVTLVGGMKGDM